MTGKTLKELNVQPGDVVYCEKSKSRYFTQSKTYIVTSTGEIVDDEGDEITPNLSLFRIISRASDTPKLWRDMTPEEKGALLLAHHEGKVIENKGHNSGWIAASPYWDESFAYRIRPEPKVETVTFEHAGCRFTFNLTDGDPDCDSVKMEEL